MRRLARRPVCQRLTARLAALRSNARGATVIEFAIVLPMMLLAIMALMDLGYQVYVQSVLTGAVQRAGRDSTIETNISGTSAIDAKVLSLVQSAAPMATFASPPSRQNFASFQQVNHTGPEPLVDTNRNGVRDPGECFDDLNGNGVWDNQTTADTGSSGTGGASDVVAYTVTINYTRLFPLSAFLGGGSNTVRLTSTTILRNQPFASQSHQETTIC